MLRNPYCPTALSADELVVGLRIITFTPGENGSRQPSYVDEIINDEEHGEHRVLLVHPDGNRHEAELVSIGVLPDRYTGEWPNVVSVLDDGAVWDCVI